MKSVLISIKPKYCELIASGKKTVEVRKTKPKLETPFKCYIYCTSKYDKSGDGYFRGKYCGKVIGEFVCNHITNIEVLKSGLFTGGYPNGHCKSIVENSMLSALEIKNYANTKANVYGWHISDLVIYDRPKDVSEFKKYNRTCYYSDLGFAIPKCSDCRDCNLKRPFQSWGYVEGYNE